MTKARVASTQFPIRCSTERSIPAELWPDLQGLLKARIAVSTPGAADIIGELPLWGAPRAAVTIAGDIDLWDPGVKAWQEFWIQAGRFPLVSIDTETSGLRPAHGSRLVGVSGAFWDGQKVQAGYWNFRHSGHAAHDGCPGYREAGPFVPLSELPLMNVVYRSCIIAGQNFKFDAKMGAMDGLIIPRRVLDTRIIAHLYDETLRKYNLDFLAREMGEQKLTDVVAEYISCHKLRIEDTGHAQVPYKIERPYAIMDAVLVLRRLQWERERWATLRDPRMMTAFQIDNACTHTYALMELAGMRIDVNYARRGVSLLKRSIAGLEGAIYKAAGNWLGEDIHKFKILSGDELWAILEARGFKPLSLTPDNKPCLDDDNLAAYHDNFCSLVREYRAQHKTLVTYFRAFVEDYTDANGVLSRAHVDQAGLVHSDYWIDGTVSGRTSSRDPNLQNLKNLRKPREKVDCAVDMLEVRRCFIPRDTDYSLFFFDYNQFELRILADYSGEDFMISEFARDADLHGVVAREGIPGCPDPQTDQDIFAYYRSVAKRIQFGIVYGMGVGKLALSLDVPVDECARLLELAKMGWNEDPSYMRQHVLCTYTPEEIDGVLEDHRVMWQNHQYSGIDRITKEVNMKINPGPLEKLLIRGGKNLRLAHSAKEYMARYHRRFPKIKEFTDSVKKTVRRRGYLFNLFGRRYHLDANMAYIGVNRLVQGTAGDIKKIAAVRIARMLEDAGAYTRLINDVHDDLQFDVHHSEIDLVPKIQGLMEDFPQVQVKLKVDISYSHISWSDKQKWAGPAQFTSSLAELRRTAEKAESIPKKKRRRTT